MPGVVRGRHAGDPDRDPGQGATFEGGCIGEWPAGGSECLSTTTQRTCGQFDADPCRECGAEHQLSVLPLAEAAVGTVTSAPEGITLWPRRQAVSTHLRRGVRLTLTATSDPQAVFAGWALVPLGDTNAWPASARWRRAR